jgi:high-affinity iron transporter
VFRLARQLLMAPLAALVLLTAIAGPVGAVEVTPEQGVAELTESRELLQQAVELYANGEPELALATVRSAYLDHFELVEFPLRVRDEILTLELEEMYADVRSLMQTGGTPEAVRTATLALQVRLNDAERTLSSPGVAAPVLTFAYSFTILFREGLEAMLIVAMLLGALAAARALRYRRAILGGVATALAASVVTWIVILLVLNLAPVQRELLEAAMTLLAVVLLFYVSFWLIARMDQRRWMEFMKAKISVAAGAGSATAMFMIGFTAVYREGVETGLFYQALLSFARGLEAWVVAGMALAAAVLGGVGWVIFVAGRRIPVKRVLGTAVVMIMVLSVAFFGNAIRAGQEIDLIPLTVLKGVPALPFFLAELTGWHPTLETIAAQAALAMVYIGGAVWTFYVVPRRIRRAALAAEGRRMESATGA